ncbi:TetR/AcrR family transcriptional regulator [Paracoccus xiamenensis]|uniref:TetR/AcrR family transcriptional regulator n=1 Tax=Paracoccus xiamenensis TaxID=2714901 RepID=UPI00140A5795|nr:TetR/AcrR family transcriptional regulator [Paracoccus xiamenensis]NHF72373.1 TetR/AcrR family transcriptional regulator [Paracoccus xiamenensis]
MTGRPRSIDRDKVLDAAEGIVTTTGAAGLTFEAVARAAGITKGGVQYCFGTKEKLIGAMIDRWSDAFEVNIANLVGPDPAPAEVVRGHLTVTRDEDAADHSRSAVMMTALLDRPERVAELRDWYMQRLAGLDLGRDGDRRVALAFLAGEGAFLLRALGLIEFEDADWTRLFDDMLALLGPGRTA